MNGVIQSKQTARKQQEINAQVERLKRRPVAGGPGGAGSSSAIAFGRVVTAWAAGDKLVTLVPVTAGTHIEFPNSAEIKIHVSCHGTFTGLEEYLAVDEVVPYLPFCGRDSSDAYGILIPSFPSGGGYSGPFAVSVNTTTKKTTISGGYTIFGLEDDGWPDQEISYSDTDQYVVLRVNDEYLDAFQSLSGSWNVITNASGTYIYSVLLATYTKSGGVITGVNQVQYGAVYVAGRVV